MGKRELIILAAFALVGMVAYQLTAPPPKEGQRRFTLSTLLSHLRDTNRGNSVSASTSQTGAFPATRTLRSVRLSSAPEVTVIGEDRADVTYSMTVEAMGPDKATAEARASGTTVKPDDLGDVLALVMTGPTTGRGAIKLMVKVPRGLAIRIDGARRTRVSGVAEVFLDNLTGETTVSSVAGGLSGTHRNGPLTVSDVGSLSLTLVGSKAVLSKVRGASKVIARNGGQLRVEAPSGPVDVEMNVTSVTVTEPSALVSVTGTGNDESTLAIDRPSADVKVDVKRVRVSMLLTAPVPATILTTTHPLRLTLADGVPVTVDAAAVRGSISASDFNLVATVEGDEAHLTHSFGDRARIALRNQNGEIVIARRK